MKKMKLFFTGALSLIVFGLLLPQSIQALLVLFDTPIKDFFAIHTLSLCVIVGLIQGTSEECGYYWVLRTLSGKKQPEKAPFYFGLGRSSLHTLFDIGAVLFTFTSVWGCALAIISRMLSFEALMKLTMLDYLSYQKKSSLYLALSVLLHAVLNSVLYAYELNIINSTANFESWFIIIYSSIIIIFIALLYKKSA